jgi:hypothetical protein
MVPSLDINVVLRLSDGTARGGQASHAWAGSARTPAD